MAWSHAAAGKEEGAIIPDEQIKKHGFRNNMGLLINSCPDIFRFPSSCAHYSRALEGGVFAAG